MAIKRLQQNFTTPKQSKKLLDLGLPADSADCYHNRIAEKPFILSMPYSYSNWDKKNNPPLPCWSVGRLIEIFEICTGERFSREIDASTLQLKTLIEDIITQTEKHLKMTYRRLDFSKLEE